MIKIALVSNCINIIIITSENALDNYRENLST